MCDLTQVLLQIADLRSAGDHICSQYFGHRLDIFLEPKLSILDETDSGLDVDALRIVAEGFNKLRTPETSALVITHYQRLLDYLKPDVVHVLLGGRIVKSGGPELAVEIENKGFDWIKAETSAV